jgi:hypothetical protein
LIFAKTFIALQIFLIAQTYGKSFTEAFKNKQTVTSNVEFNVPQMQFS